MNSQTHTIIALRLAAVAVLAVASTGTAVDLTKLPAASIQQGVTYAKDIKPIFEASSCTRCHGAERPKAGLRLDSLEGVLKGSKEGKVIQPGKSEKSDLVIAVARLDPETAMPPKPKPGRRGAPGGPGGPGGPAGMQGTNGPAGGPGQRNMGPPPKPLTPEQVGLVRAWIDQGAK
jgi:cytochrome c551/c552